MAEYGLRRDYLYRKNGIGADAAVQIDQVSGLCVKRPYVNSSDAGD